MPKVFFKGMQITGKAFCIYNTSKTAKCVVYSYQGQTYFKPKRIKATNAVQINGVGNLVRCTPFTAGKINGYKEI